MPHLVLYDGVCGLCNRLVRFLLARDHEDRFRFAPLQSDLAQQIARRQGFEVDLDTMYVVADYGESAERSLRKGPAVLFALRQLRGGWRIARVLEVLPTRLIDAVYDLVARWRYRLFGKYDRCAVPEERHRKKFIA